MWFRDKQLREQLDAALLPLARALRDVLEQQRRLMSGFSDLQTNFTALQAAVTGQNDTINNTVVPDIQKAITLIQNGNNDAALEALAQTASTLTTSTSSTSAALQAADTSLQGAEGAPAPPKA